MTTATATHRESIECQDCGLPIVITMETFKCGHYSDPARMRGWYTHEEVRPVSSTVYSCQRCERNNGVTRRQLRARGYKPMLRRMTAYQRAPLAWPVRG